jgi:hypothetical protein
MNEFKFTLIGFMPDYDVFRYIVSCDDFTMTLLLVGVDVSRFCNPLSNVDFVHLFWDNCRRFSFKKYTITILPPPIAKPRMLCLQYYRAKSNGWRDSGNFDDCVEENTLSLSAITGCSKLNTCCSCTICVRQPPSLAHLAAHTLLNYTQSLKRVTLNEDTAYQQYVYACRSPQVSISSRLPPEYPTVQLWFQC